MLQSTKNQVTKEGRKAASMAVSDIKLAKFNDQDIEVFTNSGVYYVALNSICQNMGLDWSSQRKKLMDDSTLKSLIKKKK